VWDRSEFRGEIPHFFEVEHPMNMAWPRRARLFPSHFSVRRVAVIFVLALASTSHAQETARPAFDLVALERDRILKAADDFLNDEPITVTASSSPRSAGGQHDFFSEGDYWWPDPKNPDAPYIQRDGMTNPDNFVDHRHAMIRFSIRVGTLVSAYRITGEEKYAKAAIKHIRAWFVDEPTRMNPNLEFAQAIKGRYTGRGTGIIDTVHLIEVARGAQLLEKAGALKGVELDGTKQWFRDYLEWMSTSKNGIDEMKAANNHGTCWVMQAAALASFVGDQPRLAEYRRRFKEEFMPKQMARGGEPITGSAETAPPGSFPQELRRTKPYGYSLFNADAMATVCQILSTPEDNLWQFTLPDGRNMRMAAEFLYPYIQDKSTWPFRHDVMFWDNWPVRSPILLFAGLAYNEPRYLELWKSLEASPTNEEVIRNLPIRYPLLWVD
jgi:hypothetical protein